MHFGDVVFYPFSATGVDESRLGPSVMVVDPPVERATADLSFRPTSPATMSTPTATSTSASPVILLDITSTIPAASTKYIPVAASNKPTILPVTEAKSDESFTFPSELNSSNPNTPTDKESSMSASDVLDFVFPSTADSDVQEVSVSPTFQLISQNAQVTPYIQEVLKIPSPRERKPKKVAVLPKAVTSARAMLVLEQRKNNRLKKASKQQVRPNKIKLTCKPAKTKKPKSQPDENIVSLQCPGCKRNTGNIDEFIDCTTCGDVWHIKCTGEKELVFLKKRSTNYMFVCKKCL